VKVNLLPLKTLLVNVIIYIKLSSNNLLLINPYRIHSNPTDLKVIYKVIFSLVWLWWIRVVLFSPRYYTYSSRSVAARKPYAQIIPSMWFSCTPIPCFHRDEYYHKVQLIYIKIIFLIQDKVNPCQRYAAK